MRHICSAILVLGIAMSVHAATHTVDVGPGLAFSPDNLTIVEGDTVTWNFLAPSHTTTSNATTGADAWDSGVTPSGGTFSHTFTTLGDHPYYCAVHSFAGGTMMNGVISVAGAPVAPVITSINPTSGDVAGGLAVTVSERTSSPTARSRSARLPHPRQRSSTTPPCRPRHRRRGPE